MNLFPIISFIHLIDPYLYIYCTHSLFLYLIFDIQYLIFRRKYYTLMSFNKEVSLIICLILCFLSWYRWLSSKCSKCPWWRRYWVPNGRHGPSRSSWLPHGCRRRRKRKRGRYRDSCQPWKEDCSRRWDRWLAKQEDRQVVVQSVQEATLRALDRLTTFCPLACCRLPTMPHQRWLPIFRLRLVKWLGIQCRRRQREELRSIRDRRGLIRKVPTSRDCFPSWELGHHCSGLRLAQLSFGWLREAPQA